MLLMFVAHNLRTYMRVRAAEKLGSIFILLIFSTHPDYLKTFTELGKFIKIHCLVQNGKKLIEKLRNVASETLRANSQKILSLAEEKKGCNFLDIGCGGESLP